jgi:hypothetical protein
MNIPTVKKIHAPAWQSSVGWSGYALFTLCASLYLLPFMLIIFVGTDQGTFLIGAVRIVHGQVFARDFFEVMGPGTFYWLAAFFKLSGTTFLASRICLFISSLGTALAFYFLSRRVCSRYQLLPCLILAGTYFGVLWPAISHHVDSNFFALLAVVCLVLWLDRPRNSFLIAAGVLAGATTCILHPKGALLLCAFLAWLWFQRRRTSTPLSAVGLLVGGYIGIVAVVFAYFWTQGALSSLFYANFVFPHQSYGTVNAISYAHLLFKDYWTVWVTAGGGTAWIIGIATTLMFVAALPALLLFVSIRYKWKLVAPEITLYWLCGCALWLSEFHRPDIYHLVFGAPLLIILCIHALTESRRKLPGIALQLLAISAVCLAGFNCCIVLSMGTHVSATRVGSAAVVGQESTLRFLYEHTSPGEEVLVYPYSPSYYFLSATTNPTRYSFLMYNYNTPAQFHEAVESLDQKRVRYVIWDTTFTVKAVHSFPAMKLMNQNDLIMEPYLESHYKLVEDVDGIHIMERR